MINKISNDIKNIMFFAVAVVTSDSTDLAENISTAAVDTSP